MRSRLVKTIFSLSLGLWLNAQPGQAQIADPQVERVAEALRQVSLSTGVKIDGLYSDWQVKPENVTNWSRKCTGKEIAPATFAADSTQARRIVVCVLRDVMRDEYQASKNEILTVRRTAAWWLTGVSGRYLNTDIAPYTQQVVDFYLQPNRAASQPTPPLKPVNVPKAAPAPVPNPVYERYLKAGNAASQRQDRPTALLYFKRALDERPNDATAMQAILTIEAQTPENRPAWPQPTPSTPFNLPNLK
jgi:hypothetical protein